MKQQSLAAAADHGAGFEPHYPKAGNGRPPVGLERMLRMYFVQHWFNLADEACEEALPDSTALRHFVGIVAHSAVVTAANVHDKHPLHWTHGLNAISTDRT